MLLHTADFQVELINEGCLYQPESPPNKGRYQTVHYLDGITDSESSAHGVRVLQGGECIASTVLLAGSGASGIHQHSAMISDHGQLLLAVGPYLTCLSLPELTLRWATQTDDATCFGVHGIPGTSDVISHGELEIVRVDRSGSLLWRASGADIFTGSLRVDREWVEVYDFEDRRYRFDLHDGHCVTPP